MNYLLFVLNLFYFIKNGAFSLSLQLKNFLFQISQILLPDDICASMWDKLRKQVG